MTGPSDCKACDWFGRVGGERICDVHRRVAVLAYNLAVAGALCRAYECGLATATVMLFPFESDTHDATVWTPGCGRVSP